MGKAGRPEGTVKTGLKFLNEDELKKFFSAVDRSRDRRDIFMFRLILFLGLRVSECAQIKLSDLNMDSHQVTVRALKNGRDRTYDLAGKLWFKLERWLKIRHRFTKKGNPYLFPSNRYFDEHVSTQMIKNHFKMYSQIAGLNSDFSVHSLRHSCGITHAKKGKSPIEIMGWLRHRSVSSTQCYFEQITFEHQDREAAEMFAEFL